MCPDVKERGDGESTVRLGLLHVFEDIIWVREHRYRFGIFYYGWEESDDIAREEWNGELEDESHGVKRWQFHTGHFHSRGDASIYSTGGC